jgi:hypothetical protein
MQHPHRTRSLSPLLLLASLGLGGCWSQDNPLDPARCTPRCTGSFTCWNGSCVLPDLGQGSDAVHEAGPDGPRGERASSDGAIDAGRSDAATDGGGSTCKSGFQNMTSPTSNDLNAVWGSSSSDVFAVGAKGTILHFDGSKWSTMSSGTSVALSAVFGTGASEVYAAGASGTVLKYDGSAWKSVGPSTSTDFYGVYADAGEILVVGTSGVIYHYSGSAWGYSTSGTGTLTAVWGRSKNEVYAVASGGIYKYGGSSWSSFVVADSSSSYKTIWGNDYAIVVGGARTGGTSTAGLLRMFSTSGASIGPSSPSTGSNYFAAVWGSTDGSSGKLPADVFAVSKAGAVYFFGGEGWTALSSGSIANLKGVWRSEDNQLFAVGEVGTIVRYVGPWTQIKKQGTSSLTAIWGSGPTDIAIVGGSGAYLRYSSSGWTASTVTTNGFMDVWGDGAGNLYAISGNGATFSTIIWKYDGSSWSQFYAPSPPILCLYGFASSGTTLIYGGGYKHAYRYDGTSSWADSTVTGIFNRAWGSSASDVYLVADGGTIQHWDGSAWTEDTTSPTTSNLAGIWGASASEVFVVGSGGTIFEGKAGGWTTQSSGVTSSLASVHGSSSKKVVAVGSSGLALRYDGSTWTRSITGTSASLAAVWSSSATDFYAAGAGGTILHSCSP